MHNQHILCALLPCADTITDLCPLVDCVLVALKAWCCFATDGAGAVIVVVVVGGGGGAVSDVSVTKLCTHHSCFCFHVVRALTFLHLVFLVLF